jgi:MFS family permease
MALIAMMDWYISTVKASALPYIIKEYKITPSEFSWLESQFFIATFFIFLLNGLNDIVGRKLSNLILLSIMGLSGIAIVYLTPTLMAFMAFYTAAMFTTVSNMWAIPVNEEAPAANRGRLSSIIYVAGLVPLSAVLPPLIIDRLGLPWKWVYGAMFVVTIPVLVLWLFMKETKRYESIREERRSGLRKSHFYGVGVINRRDLKYIIISALVWMCWLIDYFLFMWVGYFFMTVKGYSLTQWSVVQLGSMVGMMVGGIASGWTMDRIGRNRALIVGCIGHALCLSIIGFISGVLLEIIAMASGFFLSFSYTWFVVYIPEIFPTERRGSCMGWTSTITRISYVVGPVAAAVMLEMSPKMDWYWVVTGLMMLLPILIVLLFKPYETYRVELEEIEARR